MNKVQVDYKGKIDVLLGQLPKTSLRSVLDYVEYLKDRTAWEETQEILRDKGLMQQLKQADEDWNGGSFKEGDYLDWDKVKKSV